VSVGCRKRAEQTTHHNRRRQQHKTNHTDDFRRFVDRWMEETD